MLPSFSSGLVKEMDCYQMADFFVDAGVNNIEISRYHYTPFLNKEKDVKEYRKYIDDLGFNIPEGHMLIQGPGNITSLDNTYAIDNLKRNLEVFYELGVKAAVIHHSHYGTDLEPIEKWFDIRVDAFNQLIKHIEGTDMVICLENLSRIHDYDAGHLLKMCKAVDNPKHIGICLDTGHLNTAQSGSQYDFIMQAGKWLRAIHVHDNKGPDRGDMHIMPFDTGTIKWDEVKRGLKDLNYQYLFNYELSHLIAANPIEIKKIQVKYLLEIYNAYFAF